jgi:hypothetical protein
MPDPNDDPTALLTVTMDGVKEWRNKNRQLHRYDGPAVEYPNGTKIWYRYSKVHRDDGPAMEWADGTKAWYRKGDRHRDDGPAIEYGDGRTEWYRNGRLLTAQEIVAVQERLAAPQLAKREEESQNQSAAKIQELLRTKGRQQAPRRLPTRRQPISNR